MTQRVPATVTLFAIISLISAGCTKVVTRQWSETLEAEAHKQSLGEVTVVVNKERQVFKFNNGGQIDLRNEMIVGYLADGTLTRVPFADIAYVETKKHDRLATAMLAGASVMVVYGILSNVEFIGEGDCILCEE